MENIKRTIEIKNGNKWIAEGIITDAAEIYQSLTNDLIAKKINCCSYIKSIERVPLYNGYQNITVTYNNDCRAIYHIADH